MDELVNILPDTEDVGASHSLKNATSASSSRWSTDRHGQFTLDSSSTGSSTASDDSEDDPELGDLLAVAVHIRSSQ